VDGSFEHDNEPSVSIKYLEIPEYLSDCWLLRDSVPLIELDSFNTYL
jgi:hypothetical protein